VSGLGYVAISFAAALRDRGHGMNVQQKADVGFPSLIQPQDMRSHNL